MNNPSPTEVWRDVVEFTITNKKGEVFQCLIDNVDISLLSRRWHTHKRHTVRYVLAHIPNNDDQVERMHRVIMARVLGRELDPTEIVDHIDGNGLNNTRSNLRLATHSQSQANRGIHRNNKLGFKGVRRDGNKYRAQICFGGKLTNLGSFDTPEEAHAAYRAAAKEIHGEFTRG